MQLHEQYRPKTWGELIAQKKVIRRLERIRARGFGGRAYWISGASGTGKTTIAWLIANELASEWCIEEADATDLSANRVRELERQSQCVGLGKRGRAYIVNEAHGLQKPVVRQLLTTLERLPSHVAWIFTTTEIGERLLIEGCHDGSPLLSRCIRLELDTTGLDVYFAKRVAKIAKAEGLLNGKELSSGAFVELIRRHKCNLRAVLQEVEAGVIEEEILR